MSVLKVVGTGSLVEQTLFKPTTSKAPPLALSNLDGVTFTPIGPSKPLTVEIAHVYTGKYPHTILGSSPMLITTAISNLNSTGGTSEAVNFLVNKVRKNSNFSASGGYSRHSPNLLRSGRHRREHQHYVTPCFREFPGRSL